MTAWSQQDFEAIDGRDADSMTPVPPVRYVKVRAMKARRTAGKCPACQLVMIRGELITNREGPWMHATCLIAADRTRRDAGQQGDSQ